MAKQVQPRKIPTITKGNWAMFLFVTVNEFKKYSEEQKVSLLRNKTIDPVDKNNILAMEKSEQIMDYYYTKFGSFQQVIKDQIKSLEKMPKSNTSEKLEENFSKILAIFEVLKQNKELDQLKTENLKTIVKSFPYNLETAPFWS